LPTTILRSAQTICRGIEDFYVSAVAAIGGFCGLTTGSIKGTIGSKSLKSISFDATWTIDVGSTLSMVGTTRAPKSGFFKAEVTLVPDRINKDESCNGFPFDDGSDAFKFIGTAKIVGDTEPK
jgi:hypothetical protein